jgi:hypothetical protein
MLVATGTALVVLTWCLGVAIIAAAGACPALLVERGPATWRTAARALWWGLLVLAILVCLASAVWPLRSLQFSALLGAVALTSVAIAAVIVRRRGWNGQVHRRRAAWAVLASFGFAVLVFAVSALGPVTNYDTGLYHLGAIRYAMEFPTIPGLANLYQPFGYGNAGFPLAAALGNGPLGAEGYRLMNGLVIVLAVLELASRVIRSRWSPGTYVLLVGLVASVVPMLALADYWVTSPSQDSAVLIVTVVAVAYLTDAISGRGRWIPDAAAALALVLLLVLLRPTMLPFAGAMALVLFGLAVRRHREDRRQGNVAMVVLMVAAFFTAVAIGVRDYILSGWLLYPLSMLPLDVDWRAGDPTSIRDATLGFWRNREDTWGSVEGWSWVGPWLSSAARQWETYLLVAMGAAAVAALIVASRRGSVRWRPLVAAATPSVIAVVAWWLFTPPGFRFGWGPLVTSLSVPLGWALWRLAGRGLPVRLTVRGLTAGTASVLLVLACGFTLATQWAPETQTAERTWQLGPVTVPYSLAPVVVPPTSAIRTSGGVQVLVPVVSDQCWAAYPMCSPDPAPTLGQRGAGLQAGFVS